MSDDTAVAERKRIPKGKTYVDPAKAHKDAQIGVDIQDAFMTQAALYVHYGENAARAAYQVDQIKQLLEVRESAIDRAIRDELAANGEKITEALLEKRIARHPEIIAIKRALNEARFQERLAQVAVKGLEHRKDMLIQLGAHERKEREGELRLMSSSIRREEEQEMRQRFLERQRERIAAAES